MSARTKLPQLLIMLGLLAVGAAVRAQAPPRLQIVSWNMEWLADQATMKQSGFWSKCKAVQFSGETVVNGLPLCSAVAKYGRSAAAYETRKLAPLRARLAELADEGMDVLAVQEVGGAAALEAVLPAGWRVACFTQTTQAQNIGYAVREAPPLPLQWECRQLNELSLPASPNGTGRLRPGLELAVRVGGPAGPKVTLLNVHLKASCSTLDMSSLGHKNVQDCATLQRQVPVLESWIQRRADGDEPFMIVGDWNRNLEREIQHGRPARTDGSDPATPAVAGRIRHIWPEINDGAPAGSAMSLVQVDRKPAQASGCHLGLDQAVASQLLLGKLRPQTLVAGRLGATLLPTPSVSDHCPLRADLHW